ncbi:type II toxin-antitoxin system VapC family toxin [Pedobacter alluvionis]|uniref:PIN domain nuclease of toxin-antitoxin system n=1 Tax=Pedobacter alluvionis TaxID=475253 RepID=A0A497Y347_9SPHI|nr:type II toxin-antitoxin system VapC family toxin [Pedobacter alluvionis]RLJ76660.1 PIN domain nuclease of toxin-antitoxin system [Pedobacter alluvionis]TFB34063.1 type II toxin-antitoxin system VapC family toxin [Pedobacter alluvionis]
MIYLLDTHVFLWTIIDTKRLSEKALSVIENSENTIFVSAISLWEISLKYALGKLNLIGLEPNELIGQAKALGFELIPILPESAASHYKLNADWHRDPFDRMLIWQAIQKNIILISKDENINKYQSVGLKVVW